MRMILALTASLVLSSGMFAAPKAEDVTRYMNDLKAKEAKVRANAAEELGKIGQIKASLAKPAIPALMEALKDSDAKVRANAALALGQCDPEPAKAVPALAAMVKNEGEENSVRLGAAAGLAAMGSAAKDGLKEVQDAAKKADDLAKANEKDKKKFDMYRNFARTMREYAKAIQR